MSAQQDFNGSAPQIPHPFELRDALIRNDLETARSLLDRGADPNKAGTARHKLTPLVVAAEVCHGAIPLLLGRGALAGLPMKDGTTAASIIEEEIERLKSEGNPHLSHHTRLLQDLKNAEESQRDALLFYCIRLRYAIPYEGPLKFFKPGA